MKLPSEAALAARLPLLLVSVSVYPVRIVRLGKEMSLFGVDVARLLERLKELLFPLAYAVFNSPVGFLLLQFSLGSVPHTNVQRLPASSGSTSNEPSASSGSNVEIIIVPCAADNYGYLLVETGTKEAIAVDPLDAERFVRILTDRSLVLTAILCTHKHWDHTGGNAKLHSLFPNVPVYGHPLDFPASNASWMMAMDLTRVNRPVHDNEILHIGSVSIQVLHTPCHTRGSVMYLLLPSQGSCSKSLFTGDTLFTGGVGTTICYSGILS